MSRRAAVMRWTLPVVLCLLVGAAINLGVCCWRLRKYEMAKGIVPGTAGMWSGFGAQGPRPEFYEDSEPGGWSVGVPGDWPRAPAWAHAEEFVGLSRTTEFAEREERGRELRRVVVLEAGWPVRCLWSADVATMPTVGIGASIMGTPAPGSWTNRSFRVMRFPAWVERVVGVRTFPIGVRVIGFAADTMVFAGGPLIAVVGVGLVRRLWWWKKGRCVGCGYELVGLPVGARCPECGRGRS
jgi:hypothetical protein